MVGKLLQKRPKREMSGIGRYGLYRDCKYDIGVLG